MRGYNVVDIFTDVIVFTTTTDQRLTAPVYEVGAISSPILHTKTLRLREMYWISPEPEFKPRLTNSKSHPLSPVRNHI